MASPKPKPVARELFKTRAYDELRSRIATNQYPPGTYLSERQLAADLGMSKTPVKAALERLEIEGFIEVSPQAGITVIETSDKDIADLFEFRVALECHVVRTLAGKLTKQQQVAWEQNLKELYEISDNPKKVKQFVKLDTEFHMMPSRFLGNKQIQKSMQQVADRIQFVTSTVFSIMPHRAPESLIAHQAIVRAVVDGNRVLAGDLTESHLWAGYEIIRNSRKYGSV
jgi:GntR family transcriptional regulator, rspAB operon transcriptional repressor